MSKETYCQCKRGLFLGQKKMPDLLRLGMHAYVAKETYYQGKRGLLGKRDTFGDGAEDFFNTTLFTTLFTTQETPLATAPKISSTPLLAFAEVSTATAPTLDANSSASSCVTCHIIIHTVSHHHTYCVTSSYILPPHSTRILPPPLVLPVCGGEEGEESESSLPSFFFLSALSLSLSLLSLLSPLSSLLSLSLLLSLSHGIAFQG